MQAHAAIGTAVVNAAHEAALLEKPERDAEHDRWEAHEADIKKQDADAVWEHEHGQDEDDDDHEDPLAGDVEPTGGYDETEHVDLRAEEINEDQYGNAVDGYGNLIYPDDEVLGPDTQEKEYTGNKLALLLTRTVKDKMSELGKSEADYLAARAVALILKDAQGRPAYNLIVRLRHPQIEAGYDFDGSTGFYLAPEGIDQDQYGRDRKYVDGHFGWDYRNNRQDGDGFSCTYAGTDPHEYAEAILTEDALVQAELVDNPAPESEEDSNR